jgi:carbamoyltransferase
MNDSILGISAYYHDSAAALLLDGSIVAAAQEERFTRKKHDSGFPAHAVEYVLSEAGLNVKGLSAIAFYDKPMLKFERLLETYHTTAPRGLVSFLNAIPVWIKEKLFMRTMLYDELKKLDSSLTNQNLPQLFFPEHHLSHAASAFYPSPFDEAAILTVDGVGEWATTTIGKGSHESISVLRELPFPHSVGLFYSAFTYYLGFRVNSGEYKLMGLAPYGNHRSPTVAAFRQKILDELVDIKEDGSVLLNLGYFPFPVSLRMCDEVKWLNLFGVRRRTEDEPILQPHMDLALACQQVTEEIVLRLARTAHTLTGSDRLVLAGGVALNCVANGRIRDSGMFSELWVQPAAGDAGGAVGAAYAVHCISRKATMRPKDGRTDAMKGSFLGPSFSDLRIQAGMSSMGAQWTQFDSFDELCKTVAKLLARGSTIGWFQGRMEWGPRALGSRSILGDPRDPGMQKRLNVKIKFREGFRPFAPAVCAEEASHYFAMKHPSPYMLFTMPVAESRRNVLPPEYNSWDMYKRLYFQRSDIPAVTHLDFSARVQTVDAATNPHFDALLRAFKQETGCAVLINTSFNVRGEPIVCTPEDAYRCFMRTDMDYLVMGSMLLDKAKQPPWCEGDEWKKSLRKD